jgi:hypothetical protein
MRSAPSSGEVAAGVAPRRGYQGYQSYKGYQAVLNARFTSAMRFSFRL